MQDPNKHLRMLELHVQRAEFKLARVEEVASRTDVELERRARMLHARQRRLAEFKLEYFGEESNEN